MLEAGQAKGNGRRDDPPWADEKARLLKSIEDHISNTARVKKLNKMLQKTLTEQQKVLNRYQVALRECGYDLARLSEDNKENMPALKDDHHNSRELKRVKTAPDETPKPKRHSLASTREHCMPANSVALASRDRRRSLPGNHGTESAYHQQKAHESMNSTQGTAWTKRKRDFHDSPEPMVSAPIIAQVQPHQHQPRWRDLSSARVKHHQEQKQEHTQDSLDEFLDEAGPGVLYPRRKSGSRMDTLPTKTSSLKRSSSATTYAMTPLNCKERVFPYVEVVRNRELRASLPGHDCDECRKYYRALGGLVSESEMKANCSRHRARFEPYNTPDDFWRLSFPDSVSDSQNSQ